MASPAGAHQGLSLPCLSDPLPGTLHPVCIHESWLLALYNVVIHVLSNAWIIYMITWTNRAGYDLLWVHQYTEIEGLTIGSATSRQFLGLKMSTLFIWICTLLWWCLNRQNLSNHIRLVLYISMQEHLFLHASYKVQMHRWDFASSLLINKIKNSSSPMIELRLYYWMKREKKIFVLEMDQSGSRCVGSDDLFGCYC
jgi:hypothetical protein